MREPWPAAGEGELKYRLLVVDGPFLEAKETIAGYGIVEVADLDAAIAIAKGWPAPRHQVEVRPIVPR